MLYFIMLTIELGKLAEAKPKQIKVTIGRPKQVENEPVESKPAS